MNEPDRPRLGAPEAPRTFRHLDASAAWNLVLERSQGVRDDLVLFDVRDEKAFAQAHVDGAIHLDETRVPAALAQTPKTSSIVVYCYHGNASQMFASLFASFGFAQVFSVDGGFDALAKEHASRRAAAEDESRGSPEREQRYLVGDVVFSREPILNDGGVPSIARDALVAAAGARGVVVQVGRAEVDPRLTVYAVRFEDERGELGPEVGCLPEELTQEAPAVSV